MFRISLSMNAMDTFFDLIRIWKLIFCEFEILLVSIEAVCSTRIRDLGSRSTVDVLFLVLAWLSNWLVCYLHILLVSNTTFRISLSLGILLMSNTMFRISLPYLMNAMDTFFDLIRIWNLIFC